ncbi:MAG TPA: glycoside hydrolase family 3 C-terminal domain-containing protein [Candidatus Mediterraneibacter merdavium]|nr:glycoside hydrolase family 3 C-terminal domain-containing protein [Candidatus Mediterraneibacter merdavium]
MEKKKGTGVKKWGILTAISAILMVALIIGSTIAFRYTTTINVALDVETYKIVKGDSDADTEYFKSDFASDEEREAYEEELCARLEEEGAALLMNDNEALPLSSGAKVSLFAHGSVDLMYGGTGSGAVDTASAPSFKDALTSVGIEVNETLWDLYSSEDMMEKYSRLTPDAISDTLEANTQYGVNEAPWSEIEGGAADSFADYGDAAIVVLARSGGEGADLPSGENGTDDDWIAGTEGDGNYLALSQEEKDLLAGLKELKDDGTFKSIIVLLNSSNAIELDFLNPDICGVDYGIDSCMWIGDVGQTGINGVARLIAGEVSPSGSIVDTFTYDNMTNPAMYNFYTQAYPNAADYDLMTDGPDVQGMYSVYQEGVYLGYRYYETRYEDAVMGTANVGDYDYTSQVAYSFGHGISYTDFEYSDYSVTAGDDGFDVNVTVTNAGDTYTGKKTVQVYFQSPYTDYDKENGIEKASVELCGFAKTDELAPGESEDVTIHVDKDELRTYDSNNAKTYILDAGDYYFTVADGAHEAVNNVLAAKGYTTADGMDAEGDAAVTYKWTNSELDTEIFSTSEATGAKITNLFDESDPNKSSDAPGEVTWLTRSDWEGTFPTAPAELTVNDTLAASLAITQYDGSQADSVEMPTLGADGDLALASLIGADYDDPMWEDLLDQLTYEDMVNTITLGFHNTAAIPNIGKAATKDENGPQGLTAALTGGESAMCYTSEDVMAATFNTELMEDVGRCIGEDCLAMGYSGLYGPGVNMHRTAYSGRNFEYYSEDPHISGAICTAEVQGIQSKGVYVYLKHVALNDSESSRRGVNTWLNEQTAREIYLEVADKAVIDGGAWCTMSGFNRWGSTWCGAYAALQTDYLRGELGMRGMSITDYSGSSKYMDLCDALIAGTDIYDSPDPTIHTANAANYENDAYIVTQMREAMHNILYTVVNSNAMNGLSEADTMKQVTPWWQIALIALIVVFGVLTVVCAVMTGRAVKRKKADTAPASQQK